MNVCTIRNNAVYDGQRETKYSRKDVTITQVIFIFVSLSRTQQHLLGVQLTLDPVPRRLQPVDSLGIAWSEQQL